MRGVTWVVMVLAASMAPAWGDGFVAATRAVGAPIALTEERQRAAIVLADGVETLIVGVTAAGQAREAAWLVPVPGTVAREQIELARPALLRKLFELTAPVREREVDSLAVLMRTSPLSYLSPLDALLGPHPGTFAGGGGTPGRPSPVAGVTLYAAFELGPYHLDLLSAQSGDELVGWLSQHDYELPPGLGALADQDLRLGRRFVAVRLSGAGDQPVPAELPPLRIAFPASEPWFPLRISQASAPERVLLELVVAAATPVTSVDLPELRLADDDQHLGVRRNQLRRGRLQDTPSAVHVDVAERRRRAAADLGYAGLVREAQQPLEHKVADGFGLTWRQPGELWLTRYSSLLNRSAMTDLRFAPTAALDVPHQYRPRELGLGHPRLPWWVRLLGSPWWAVLLVLVLTLRGWQPARGRALPDSPPDTQALRIAVGAFNVCLLTLVVMALGRWLAVSVLDWLDDSMDLEFLLSAFAFLLLPPVVLVTAVSEMARQAGVPREALVRWGWFFAAVVLAVCAAEDLHYGDLGRRQPEGFALLVLWLALIATVLAFGGRRWAAVPRRAHLPFLLMTSLMCGLAIGSALDLAFGAAVRWVTATDPSDVAEPLRAALKQFRADHGAWPRQLSDLTAPSLPATGLDTAGNVVPLPPTPWHRYLETLPPEPLSRGQQPWRYDPSDELVVDAQWQFN